MSGGNAATQVLETVKKIPGTRGSLRTLRQIRVLRKSVSLGGNRRLGQDLGGVAVCQPFHTHLPSPSLLWADS